MTRDPRDLALRLHKEWLGYLQPVGLVVSGPAMVDTDCLINTDIHAELARFREILSPRHVSKDAEPIQILPQLQPFLLDILGWKATDLVAADDPRAVSLNVYLEGYDDHLRPTQAVIEDHRAESPKWLMLLQELPIGQSFDAIPDGDNRKWQATPQTRLERLLRETQVPTGVLSNGVELRLVYAPRGESPGHVTFPIQKMLETSGRLIFAALFMLLRESRIFGSTGGKTLNDILAASRRYQNTVSTALADQVLAALYELLRGFQAADAHRKGELLREVLTHDPDQVYAGQLTVLLRLVFLLYAEDRGLVSDAELYLRHYSVIGLFEKLRTDAGQHPDTMDQRYGAWARLITLFRMIHFGADGGGIHVPARAGYLFQPDRYPFLEGRAFRSTWQVGERLNPPLISDGVVYRVLQNLLILNGERLSYRALDVEQIGSVYEAMMGFRLETAKGRGIAIKSKKAHGAPITIDLDAFLAQSADKRGKWFKDHAELDLTPKELAAIKTAQTVEDLVAALQRKIVKEITPNIVPTGSMVLQPSPERRRSGSHYTPRSLTSPIVEKALAPILKQLGDQPKPDEILNLKICDPAMGSGAFLVEACRQLGEVLVRAWVVHRQIPAIPPDEDELLHAQRLIAQRCLYGVDKNPMATNLAKLSLWLTTLAKDHPFTFLDHSLKSGDSLVGLTREQIIQFHWNPTKQQTMGQEVIETRIRTATKLRQDILDAGDYMLPGIKQDRLNLADEALDLVRFAGNLVVAAFFASDKDKIRQQIRDQYLILYSAYLNGDDAAKPIAEEAALRKGDQPIHPFHWEIEFPEVFRQASGGRKSADSSGFDCIVGNPPFAGKNTIGEGNRSGFLDWLKVTHAESHGNADLVAHFFRRAFNLIRKDGAFGLIATNTIAQGDTRSSGLRWICTHGGTIYAAKRRYKWPGQAAVVVSVVHIIKSPSPLAGEGSGVRGLYELDDRPVNKITAYLFHAGGHDDPARLKANESKSFKGVDVNGMGFTFDDTDTSGVANPILMMNQLISSNSRNAERIFPFIGGEELNNHPQQKHHRYVINFEQLNEQEARCWPELIQIVEIKVKPDRLKNPRSIYGRYWWQFAEKRLDFLAAKSKIARVLCSSEVSPNWCVAFVPSTYVCAQTIKAFALPSSTAFALLQSRIHEIWARFFGSTLEDRLRYTPSDCFETFPFPPDFENHSGLEAIGEEYYEFRAALMIQNNEGLTKTYNRFHDPDERRPEILQLRQLHDQMDRAVLQAYGPPFSDLVVPKCEFLLDYEEEEDEEDTGKRQKKKPWRYRWPDLFRDEVLALLLDLNKQRAEEEKKATAPTGKIKAPRKPRKPKDEQAGFPDME
jgi:hypothetical protein